MSWKIYGERMCRAMQLDDRFEIKVIERRASAVASIKMRDSSFLLISIPYRCARIYRTPCVCGSRCQNTWPPMLAAATVARGKREKMRVFFAEGESREFISRKRSRLYRQTVNSLIYSSYTIYRPEFLEPFELYTCFCRSRGNKFSQHRMIQHIYRCI